MEETRPMNPLRWNTLLLAALAGPISSDDANVLARNGQLGPIIETESVSITKAAARGVAARGAM